MLAGFPLNCIHLKIFYTSRPVQAIERLESFLACTALRQSASVYHRANINSLTFTPLGSSEFPVHLTCMSLHCDWKLELQKTEKSEFHRESPSVIKSGVDYIFLYCRKIAKQEKKNTFQITFII